MPVECAGHSSPRLQSNRRAAFARADAACGCSSYTCRRCRQIRKVLSKSGWPHTHTSLGGVRRVHTVGPRNTPPRVLIALAAKPSAEIDAQLLCTFIPRARQRSRQGRPQLYRCSGRRIVPTVLRVRTECLRSLIASIPTRKLGAADEGSCAARP